MQPRVFLNDPSDLGIQHVIVLYNDINTKPREKSANMLWVIPCGYSVVVIIAECLLYHLIINNVTLCKHAGRIG